MKLILGETVILINPTKPLKLSSLVAKGHLALTFSKVMAVINNNVDLILKN